MEGLDDEDEEEGVGNVEDADGWEIKVPPMDGGVGGVEMEEVYEEAVRTLLRLQGEGRVGSEEEEEEEEEDTSGSISGGGAGGAAGLATTVGKIERAERAAEVVEKM